MKKSDLLKQQLAEKRERLQALYNAANKEGEVRNYTETEQSEVDGIVSEIRSLENQISLEEGIEEEMRKAAEARGKKVPSGPSGGEQKEKSEMRKSYSLLKAVREMAGPGLTGVEKELHEEGIKNSRSAGVSVQGLALPNFIFNPEKRAISSGGNATALTEPYGGFIEALRVGTVVGQLGARTLGNLSGEVVMPNMTAGAATWEGETDQNTDSGASFGGIKMAPNRLSAYVDVSKQFLNQASFDAEAMLRQDLTLAVSEAVDAAAINGSGTGEPTGILNTAGIGSVNMGANGGAITWPKAVELESEVAAANALRGSLAYLTTPGGRGSMKTTAKDAGSGQFIWSGSEVNGYRAASSNNVPSDLTKGTSSGVCHAAIFGDFSQVIIGQWGGVDVVVDMYTLARTGQVRLVVNGYFDVKLRHAESFAAIKDLLV
jgi:HK97 family phage major capsid protein